MYVCIYIYIYTYTHTHIHITTLHMIIMIDNDVWSIARCVAMRYL